MSMRNGDVITVLCGAECPISTCMRRDYHAHTYDQLNKDRTIGNVLVQYNGATRRFYGVTEAAMVTFKNAVQHGRPWVTIQGDSSDGMPIEMEVRSEKVTAITWEPIRIDRSRRI